MRTGWRCIAYVLAAYLALLLLLMLSEESLIYFPAKYPEGDYHPAGLAFEDAYFTAADGTRLHGWYVPHENARAVILFAHGNAGNLSYRADVLRVLHRRLQATVMIFDYRGYGRSQGSPTEAGLTDDARAARAWLSRRSGATPRQIVLLGRSLGGAVMVDLAVREGARALVLESTFSSLPDVAAWHYWWAPVRWLMRNRFDARAKIAAYQGPLFQSHGDADEIVPYRLGRQLFDAAPSPAKRFVTIPGGNHNDPQPPSYYDQLATFLASHGGPTAADGQPSAPTSGRPD